MKSMPRMERRRCGTGRREAGAHRRSRAERIVGGLSIPGVKYAMDFNGYFGGPVRLPLLPLTAEAKAEIEKLMDEHPELTRRDCDRLVRVVSRPATLHRPADPEILRLSALETCITPPCDPRHCAL